MFPRWEAVAFNCCQIEHEDSSSGNDFIHSVIPFWHFTFFGRLLCFKFMFSWVKNSWYFDANEHISLAFLLHLIHLVWQVRWIWIYLTIQSILSAHSVKKKLIYKVSQFEYLKNIRPLMHYSMFYVVIGIIPFTHTAMKHALHAEK